MALPVVIVVAAADNGVIGRDNGLIWRLKTDLRRFRSLTLGRPLVMGRKTFESIGKPLPGRETIVVTRNPSFRPEGAAVAGSLEEALALGQEIGARIGADCVVVGGGADIYAQALPLAERIHLTRVHAAPQGDSVFPALDPARYRTLSRESHPAGPDDEFPFEFVDLQRV
ncbi:MAG: dihydrofolate reductase [Burkholderiales bacterium]|jgi:dihydrofolate reductase|nr:dihydrofolate reductase [Burkholderiales bacterium]